MGSTPTTGTNRILQNMSEGKENLLKKFSEYLNSEDPLKVGLISFLITVFISRLIGFLVIDEHALPKGLFLDIHGFRLHHFVYGNFIITILGFFIILLGAQIPSGIAALIYGVGLGMVMDEFVLWLGSIRYLSVNSLWVFNIVNSTAVIVVTAIMLLIIRHKNKTQKNNDI